MVGNKSHDNQGRQGRNVNDNRADRPMNGSEECCFVVGVHDELFFELATTHVKQFETFPSRAQQIIEISLSRMSTYKEN